MIIYQFLTYLTPVCTKIKHKMITLQRDKYYLGMEPKQKNFKIGGARFMSTLGILKYIAHCIIEWVLGVMG